MTLNLLNDISGRNLQYFRMVILAGIVTLWLQGPTPVNLSTEGLNDGDNLLQRLRNVLAFSLSPVVETLAACGTFIMRKMLLFSQLREKLILSHLARNFDISITVQLRVVEE